MVLRGILKYGWLLCVVEFATMGSFILLKAIIEELVQKEAHSETWPRVLLFTAFVLLRLLAILSRSYYDLYVFNYFRFV